MRAIGATPSGSYAVNQGPERCVGDIDTGIDLTHPDITPNVDVAASCVFIYAYYADVEAGGAGDARATAPTRRPSRTYAGHGTHTAGTIAAPINGKGMPGVAPKATIVVLKAGTEKGYFFTESVVDALSYAGDQRLDAVNMSFFADPWLFNCRNDRSRGRSSRPSPRGALRGAAGCRARRCRRQRGHRPNHPTTDEISPDFPPGAASRGRVNNSCVVLPTEIPGVVVVTATGAENLLAWYSTYGNLTDVTAPGGSRYQTPTDDSARGRVLAPYSSTARDLAPSKPRSVGLSGPGRRLLRMAERHLDGGAARGGRRRAHPRGAPRDVGGCRGRGAAQHGDQDGLPGSPRSGGRVLRGSVQVCSGGVGSNNFYGKGLVNALAAAG